MQYNDLKIGNNTTLTNYFLFTAEEAKAYRKLEELIKKPAGIVVFLKELISTKDDVLMLFDGSTKTEVISSGTLNKKAFSILHHIKLHH
jgi:hypothetical protein